MDRVREKYELYVVSLWLFFLLVMVITLDVPISFGGEWYFIGVYEIIKRNVVPFIALFFLLIGVVNFYRFDYVISGAKSIPVRVESVRDVNYEHLTFLTTYIIPLICFDLGKVRYVIALCILLVVIGVIYVKTDKFYANPTLAMLGYHLYEVAILRRTGERVNVVLITKDRIMDGSLINYLELDDRVYYAKEVK